MRTHVDDQHLLAPLIAITTANERPPIDHNACSSHQESRLPVRIARHSFIEMPGSMRLLISECIGEFLGTWLMVFIGTATVASAVTTGAQAGLWQVAVVWGFAVALSIYLTAQISSAHLNPAVTLSLAVSRRTCFPWSKVLPYIVAQLLGAITSGACVLILYGSALARYEKLQGITRGEANSTLSAMAFGEYFPNPQIVLGGALEQEDVTPFGAMLVEALGTMILMLLIRALTDDKNTSRPSAQQVPFFIGFTVSAMISILAPLSQAGFNPARDFGPRIVAAFAGWSTVAIPGPQNGFWVYIVGPILGAVVGGVLYDAVVFPAYIATLPEASKEMVASGMTMASEETPVKSTSHILSPASLSHTGSPRHRIQYHTLNDV